MRSLDSAEAVRGPRTPLFDLIAACGVGHLSPAPTSPDGSCTPRRRHVLMDGPAPDGSVFSVDVSLLAVV